jgi:hypothetical protein
MVNYNYQAALNQSLLVIEDDMLILREPVHGGSSFTCLQLVPNKFYNIIFVAFHSNAIDGHLNAYRTLHRIRLHYYWPGMYSYIKRMCNACPGCALANPTKSKSSELVYNFPIEMTFLVLFIDAYSAGKHSSFDGSETYLIAPMMFASGDWSKLYYRNQCPCTLHASKMAVSSLNFESAILLTCNTMHLILASGCNITLSLNSNPHYLRRTYILFGHLILQRITPLDTNYFLFVNGLT